MCDKQRSRAASVFAHFGIILGLLATVPVAVLQTNGQQSAPTAKSTEQVPAEVQMAPGTTARRVPPRPGDVCALCKCPIDDGDVVYLVAGHRFPIHLAELDPDVRAELARLVGQQEPRGAFLGAGPSEQPLFWGWFLLGLYVLLGLVFAALCAHRAFHAGQNPRTWFLLGFALNVVAYILLRLRGTRPMEAPAGVPAGLSKIAATYRPEPCPACGTLNHPAADRCIGCGAKLAPRIASEVVRAGLTNPR